MNPLHQPAGHLKGVGAQTALRLEKLGIERVEDLLFHLPSRYEDRTRSVPIADLKDGMSALLCGQIQYTATKPQSKNSLLCRIQDNTGELTLRFFHINAPLQNQLKPGAWIRCYGDIRTGLTEMEMTHPDVSLLKSPEQFQPDTHLTPIYPTTAGLSQYTLRRCIKQAIALSRKHLTDLMPKAIIQQYNWPELQAAIANLHAPPADTDITRLENGDLPALKRLAYEELISHHLCLRQAKHIAKGYSSPVLTLDPHKMAEFIASLPFPLTGAQQRVIAECAEDCAKPHPMQRLIQGDVGSGKTLVSASVALIALHSGYQVALMAPTELLAEQHYRNFKVWFSEQGFQIAFLTGQIKGKQRTQLLAKLADGTIHLVIGTHALIQTTVQFKQIGLMIIDEQHRFGVHQRLALQEKAPHGHKPHQLVMTATPIPRTLAMLSYADLDLSIIDEMPPGRTPIITRCLPAERREEITERIQNWVTQGRQVYWVCTRIEASETLQCQAVEQTAMNLQTALPDLRIGLVHGRMKPADKERMMLSFKKHQIDVLVATTVIEVGVDVPNANLMIIENPERLGLAQLHQLRGRVGRGGGDSYCLLIYQTPLTPIAKQRLGILRDTLDGFKIADADLHLRGQGDIMGTRQTGMIHFKVADLSRDAELIQDITQASQPLYEHFSPSDIADLSQRWLRQPDPLTGV